MVYIQPGLRSSYGYYYRPRVVYLKRWISRGWTPRGERWESVFIYYGGRRKTFLNNVSYLLSCLSNIPKIFFNEVQNLI